MIITIVITLLILGFSYKKPIYAIVLILNINSIRALPELDLNSFDFHKLNEGNLYLSVILPFLAYSLIVFKIDWQKKKVLYFIDSTDVFFIASIIIMTLYCIVSPNFLEGVGYTIKYLFIGIPLYYISKIVLMNSNDIKIEYYNFFKATIVASILIGSLGLYLAYSVDFIDLHYPRQYMIPIARITIPGVHPIPYCQAIGFGALISFTVIYSNGNTLGYDKRKQILFHLFLFLYLFFLVLLANTRGVLISLIIAIIFFIKLYPRKISKKTFKVFMITVFIGVIVTINFIDVGSLFNRLLTSFNNDASASARMILLQEAFHIIITNPIGVGTSGFQNGGYPHNIFLDYIVSFGVFGWALSFALFAIIIYFYVLTYNHRKKHYILILIYCVIIYFFIETLISFTLWMHKGMYLSMGLFAGYYYHLKKQNTKINTK